MILLKRILWLLLMLPLLASAQKDNYKCFKLPDLLQEVSGLYLESTNRYWWHNDSGSAPQLYLTNNKGKLKDTILLASIQNIDWEDITHDTLGNIYIGDFGNNINKRKDLRIYIYNPRSKKIETIEFEYPDQKEFPPKPSEQNFDMEAFFWFQDSLHLFSKNRMLHGNYHTKHYVLPAKGGKYIAELRNEMNLKNRVVTAAAISPDGKTVALVAYNIKKVLGFLPWSSASIFFIRNFEGNDFLKGTVYKKRAPGFLWATQLEALDFLDDQTIYIASEKTKFIKPKAKRVKLKRRFFKEKRILSNK